MVGERGGWREDFIRNNKEETNKKVRERKKEKKTYGTG